ncbi:unnamed protein product [Ranitomeya imitator]|uniref:Ig-like domain-containing protein n=1 Tax=Ranitomeya imitator TaxID=111125 RepID=A0ABN9L834_9NEOB|nr:unnamed protein product [Ranitomeya imitator]
MICGCERPEQCPMVSLRFSALWAVSVHTSFLWRDCDDSDSDYLSVSPGDTVTVSCKSSQSVYDSEVEEDLLAWYQQKTPGSPKTFSSIGQTEDDPESQEIHGSGLELVSLLQSQERQRTMQQIITVSRVIALLSHSDTEPYKNLLPSPIMSLYYNVV